MRQSWLQKPPLGTPINWTHPLAKGLVGCWLFNEGGGDLVQDLSGNKNHGTLKNMAFPPTTSSCWNPSRKGPGLKFDGTNDYVDCGNTTSLNSITDKITIEEWIYCTGLGVGNTRIIAKDYSYYWFVNSATNLIFIISIDSVTKSVTGTTFSLNAWHHVVAVYDKESVKMYIDGLQFVGDTASGNISVNTTQSVIIGNTDDANKTFTGTIDEVRIYNRALSAEEVKELYENPYGMFERTKWGILVPSEVVEGLSIPVAMHQYATLRA